MTILRKRWTGAAVPVVEDLTKRQKSRASCRDAVALDSFAAAVQAVGAAGTGAGAVVAAVAVAVAVAVVGVDAVAAAAAADNGAAAAVVVPVVDVAAEEVP